MTGLRELLGTYPSLLAKEDTKSIFSRTSESLSPLRRLAITVLVAQLHAPNSTTQIEDFRRLELLRCHHYDLQIDEKLGQLHQFREDV